MIALDTNVLVRHVTNDEPQQAPVAHGFIAGLTAEQPGFIGLTVLAEMFWVLKRSYALPATAIHDLVEWLLETHEFEVEDEESVTRALVHARTGADFADALIGDTADLHGCTGVVTLDRRAADQLGWRLLE